MYEYVGIYIIYTHILRPIFKRDSYLVIFEYIIAAVHISLRKYHKTSNVE